MHVLLLGGELIFVVCVFVYVGVDDMVHVIFLCHWFMFCFMCHVKYIISHVHPPSSVFS